MQSFQLGFVIWCNVLFWMGAKWRRNWIFLCSRRPPDCSLVPQIYPRSNASPIFRVPHIVGCVAATWRSITTVELPFLAEHIAFIHTMGKYFRSPATSCWDNLACDIFQGGVDLKYVNTIVFYRGKGFQGVVVLHDYSKFSLSDT